MWQREIEEYGDRRLDSVELHVAKRDRGVWRQTVGFGRVACGKEGQRSLETDGDSSVVVQRAVECALLDGIRSV
ncbi:hypothetical protein NP493_213g01000 [Ridgeia piscesae]|uniref:Uncharacterized protein n=1 Tax=Ridgeia piscesae TaxID=27915 RepID=A0AAD9UE74_RIDPI|nr:hypothetical protein NP493_213g01000 [Ridgeia piscesae]